MRNSSTCSSMCSASLECPSYATSRPPKWRSPTLLPCLVREVGAQVTSEFFVPARSEHARSLDVLEAAGSTVGLQEIAATMLVSRPAG